MFYFVGKGYVKSDIIVNTMSRSGSSSELVIGPVHYGLIMTLTTYFFWKQTVAIYVIMIISFGDGFAAIFGKITTGNQPLWWNPQKTWFGLVSFILTSTMGIVGIMTFYKKYFFPNFFKLPIG